MSRATAQREAIWAALEAAPGPLLPEEVLEQAQASCDSLGQATVYRALKRLEDEERIVRVTSADGRARFEIAQAHHHHFHCTDCDRVFDVPGCGVTSNSLSKRLPKGFALEAHELWLHGRCAECS